MKLRSLFTILLVPLIPLILFLSSGVSHAQTLQAGPHPVHAAPPTAHPGARPASYDSNDPLDSGCWNNNAVWANWGTISVDGYSAQVVNWYSYGCNKNWAEILWNSGIALQTYIEIGTMPGYQRVYESQCYPTLSGCPILNVNAYYTGGLSPSWTDMVDGTDKTDVYVKIRARATGHTAESPKGWLVA